MFVCINIILISQQTLIIAEESLFVSLECMERKTLLALNRHEQALFCFDECLQRDFNSVPAHHGKGLALKKLHRHKEAILCHNKCLELDPNFLLSHCHDRTLSSGFDLIVGEEDLVQLMDWVKESLDLEGLSVNES
jgi:tetratricopeptide (TPR) repeat protein